MILVRTSFYFCLIFPPSVSGTNRKASGWIGWIISNQPTRYPCQFCTSSLVPPHPPRLKRLQSSSCSLIHLENLFVHKTVLGSPSPSSFIPVRRSRPESGDMIGKFASFLRRGSHTVVQEHILKIIIPYLKLSPRTYTT